MRRVSGVLLALALVLALAGLVGTPAAAEPTGTTWYVVEGGAGDRDGTSWDDAFEKIQDAVDAAGADDTIMVAEGQYEGFVMAGMNNISMIGAEGTRITSAVSVSIDRGSIGDAWVMAGVMNSDSISITGVNFDGVGITGEEAVIGIAYVNTTGEIADLTAEGFSGSIVGAGVAIIGDEGSSVVNLSGVTVSGSMAGVVIGVPEEEGGTSTVRMTGCTISGNTVGIYVFDDTAVEAHFNKIMGNMLYGVRNDGGERVNAVNNWWGHASGPFHPTANSGGEGNAVSDMVDFAPWLTALIGAVKTGTATTDNPLDAKEEADVEVWVYSRAEITVGEYLYYPGGDHPSGRIPLDGKWFDINLGEHENVTRIEIRLFYSDDEVSEFIKEDTLRIYLWVDDEWKGLNGGVVRGPFEGGYDGYIWGEITATSIPSLDDLGGTPGGGYGSPPTPPIQGLCFIATAAYGSDTAEELNTLREFRDTVLMNTAPGAGFVSLYYRTSPPIAMFISRHEGLRTAVRFALVDPVVKILSYTYNSWSVRG